MKPQSHNPLSLGRKGRSYTITGTGAGNAKCAVARAINRARMTGDAKCVLIATVVVAKSTTTYPFEARCAKTRSKAIFLQILIGVSI